MPFIIGGASLFLAFAIVQSISAEPIIRRTYLRYALYLLFILIYFVVRSYEKNPSAKHLEAILFCGAVISYILFVKALFTGREAFAFLNDIAKLTVFAAVICLLGEKSTYFLANGFPDTWKYVKITDALLRGLLALLGLFAALLTYIKYPTDRDFSGIFLLGNLFLFLGGLTVAIITVLPNLSTDQDISAKLLWSYQWRGFVMEGALFLEILCFSLAITRRQTLLLQQKLVTEAPEHHDAVAQVNHSPDDDLPSNLDAKSAQRIAFRTTKGFELIKKSEIVIIQGGGNSANFIKIFKEGFTNPVIVSQTLTHTLRMLSDGDAVFQQVHRSYIINSQKIGRLYKDADGIMIAVMDNGMEVPISANREQDVRNLLGLE